jgi:hypothetical protein
MKNYLFSIVVLALFTFAACKQPAPAPEVEEEKIELPDYAEFDKKVEILRSFYQAHADENLEAQRELLADTLKWSPPNFNGNEWLGKEDYLAVLKSYHENFENIKYAEGIPLGDNVGDGLWAGSVFPKEEASSAANAIRQYGTWTATHTPSGKEIGVKWFAISWINDAGQIAQMTEYFDVNGLAVQIAEE